MSPTIAFVQSEPNSSSMLIAQNQALASFCDELHDTNKKLERKIEDYKLKNKDLNKRIKGIENSWKDNRQAKSQVAIAENRIEDLERELEDVHLELRESTVHYREQLLELRSENMIMAEHIDTLTKGDQ